jgi:hypothetical protein
MALPFVLASALSFGGAMALAAYGDDALRPPPLAGGGPHEIQEPLGGNRAGKLVATTDERGKLDRSEPIPFRVESRFEHTARVLLAVELVDELGEARIEPFRAPADRIGAGETASFDLEVPSHLDDGLYRYRVTVVGRSGGETADARVEIRFALLGDSIHLVGERDWLELPFVSEAVEPGPCEMSCGARVNMSPI